MAPFPTIIPKDDRLSLQLVMCKVERWLLPHLEACEEARSNAEACANLCNWLRENLAVARSLCLQAIKKVNPSLDPHDIDTTVTQIREYAASDTRHAIEHFEYYADELTRSQLRVAKRQLRRTAEFVVNQWIEGFRDWARNRKDETRDANTRVEGGAQEQPTAAAESYTAYASADTVWHEHGIRQPRLSEAKRNGRVRWKPAPGGIKDSQGRTVRILYHVGDALRHCKPKHIKEKTRRNALGKS